MKRVLVIHYSQTGQLSSVARSIAAPLEASANIEVVYEELRPVHAYPFPWPFVRFINTFPEAAHQVGCELEPLSIHCDQDFDLVILAYQVWFLAPSIPVEAFLQSGAARQLLENKPLVTVIACRNMWLMAQEKVKAHLERIGANHIGNIALCDAAGTAASFLSTPLWLLSGNKGPFPMGIPAAGIAPEEIENACRFGDALRVRLTSEQSLDSGVLQGQGAVQINDGLIASEIIATRSFFIWGKLFRAIGGPDALFRKLLVWVYAAFLLLMILTVVPISAMVKALFAPLMRKRISQQKEHYALPSGEGREHVE
jgi:hypothetical protein